MSNPLLKPAGTTVIRDYRHAARIFTDDNFRLSPKYGFLFYVEFDFNPLITSVSNLSAQELGMIVKSVNLPKYTIDTKIHNAYNRKNIVQNKISYDAVTISFHDDQSDNVRNFWYDYYSYFFRDPDYADATYSAAHKYQSRPTFDWGYTPKTAVGYNSTLSSLTNQPYQYIQAIRIYSLYQKNFSEYELINPTITSFKHGEHSNSGTAEMLSHEMTVQFETVKYHTGYVTKDNVGGFIDLHYDNTRSPIAVEGAENQITDGHGGTARITNDIVDLATGTTNPLIFNAVAAARNAANGFTQAAPFPQAAAAATTYASTLGGTNMGGFSIPSLGSAGSGSTLGGSLNNTLTAASTAANFIPNAANQVVGSIATGIGTNGSAIIGLATAAISNPKVFLSTTLNMGINYAMSYAASTATKAISDLTQPYITDLKTTLGGAAGDVTGFFTSGGAQAYLTGWSADILSSSAFEVTGFGSLNSTGEILGSLEF
jgi:hypothetical protein